jgi:hypothetical protein
VSAELQRSTPAGPRKMKNLRTVPNLGLTITGMVNQESSVRW